MKNVTITIFLLFVLTSCFDKNKPIDDNQVIQNCIKEIVNPDPKSIDSTYMINPYCNSFTFNNYTINNYENKYITVLYCL